ncbi:cilia- and flagella-associated protein 77-like [Liolophura sinensis]|uniref:cilia- and flagella-associated protein 77-like n=1 Tax=Liolophura sinensis TaxID=3198878 RepID=UPI003158E333
MSADYLSPFTHTKTGDLGVQRETMLGNELLLNPELGRPRRRGYNFPGDSSTFGRPNIVCDGGAPEALRGWAGKNPSNLPFHSNEKSAERDFMALNVAAVQRGLITAPEHYMFRATHDIRKKVSDNDNKKYKTRRLPPSMVFGIATRPSTPIFELLEHKYQDKWLQQQRAQELNKRHQEMQNKKTTGTVYETRASLLRTFQNPVEPSAPWQLPRFSQTAQPHLSTFRSESARKKAYDSFGGDKISRRGQLGHGAYASATK